MHNLYVNFYSVFISNFGLHQFSDDFFFFLLSASRSLLLTGHTLQSGEHRIGNDSARSTSEKRHFSPLNFQNLYF